MLSIPLFDWQTLNLSFPLSLCHVKQLQKKILFSIFQGQDVFQ